MDKANGRKGLSPHALRHTFALRLYADRRDLLAVMRALGHKSITSTLPYLRCDDGRLRSALNALGD
jgi:integrase/recombinase XerD